MCHTDEIIIYLIFLNELFFNSALKNFLKIIFNRTVMEPTPVIQKYFTGVNAGGTKRQPHSKLTITHCL
ncbi:hypothetical protein BpHYR1_021706 [Brachionus plicatilis]|uniref:Uncharacterized protein n=1 Tax=Brachionus plicatilis TaxID=10195 RepID=A0A3M7T5L9_BRAPC|nr:hypothetical protein BpHYR1_021706 [Brachionus plicatilis]